MIASGFYASNPLDLAKLQRKVAAMAKKVARWSSADSHPAPRVTVPRRIARRDIAPKALCNIQARVHKQD